MSELCLHDTETLTFTFYIKMLKESLLWLHIVVVGSHLLHGGKISLWKIKTILNYSCSINDPPVHCLCTCMVFSIFLWQKFINALLSWLFTINWINRQTVEKLKYAAGIVLEIMDILMFFLQIKTFLWLS